MKEELKGIALILFGILLVCASIALDDFLPGDYPQLPCYLGIIIGTWGLYSFYKQ